LHKVGNLKQVYT